jgi:nucleotide-binding universal stress UspA family protein
VREGGGTPEEAIAARTLEGDFHLVILAPAGRRGFIRLFYGSMVAHVVRRVSTSVLVVRPLSTVPPRRILVGVSGSRHSLTNVTVASQLAGFFGAELTLLTVLSQLTLDSKEAQPFESGPEAFLASDHPLAAQLRVGSEISQKMGAPAKVRVRQGLIGDQALEEIREFGHDLLVVGTHRADDFDTVYEDITDELVRMSPVSTLVVGLRAGLL